MYEKSDIKFPILTIQSGLATFLGCNEQQKACKKLNLQEFLKSVFNIATEKEWKNSKIYHNLKNTWVSKTILKLYSPWNSLLKHQNFMLKNLQFLIICLPFFSWKRNKQNLKAAKLIERFLEVSVLTKGGLMWDCTCAKEDSVIWTATKFI